MTVVAKRAIPDLLLLSMAGAVAAAALLAKFAAIIRTNINWDEFWYLTGVHRLVRGDLDTAFHSAYAWAFAWLPWLGNEIDQVIAARWCMTVLFALTALLVWKLATRWTLPTAAVIAPIAYLSVSYVIVHGGSFRADSLIAPLSMGMLLLLSADALNPRRLIAAGVLFGLALVVSTKTVLILPAAACFLLMRPDESWPRRLKSAAACGAVAAAVAAVLFGLHATFIATDPIGLDNRVAEAAGTGVLRANLFPQAKYLWVSLDKDRLVWVLVGIGFCTALAARRWKAAALAFSILPLAFYRNTYPYYYVVMLAPAAVLAAVACQEMMNRLPKKQQGLIPLLIGGALVASGLKFYAFALEDRQADQRAVVTAVHAAFSEPVPYADHAGVIGSFPKANPLLSTWGMDYYTRQGKPFMDGRAVFVLADSPALKPGAPRFGELLAADQLALKKNYVPLWGPISVAGAILSMDAGSNASIEVPVSGRYRLVADGDVIINGKHVAAGSVIQLEGKALIRKIGHVEGKLIWADAKRPALPEPRRVSIYHGFSL